MKRAKDVSTGPLLKAVRLSGTSALPTSCRPGARSIQRPLTPETFPATIAADLVCSTTKTVRVTNTKKTGSVLKRANHPTSTDAGR